MMNLATSQNKKSQKDVKSNKKQPLSKNKYPVIIIHNLRYFAKIFFIFFKEKLRKWIGFNLHTTIPFSA
jgi:hypothetical protein